MKQHNPYKSHASFAEGIDPINSHTLHFGENIGPNKRSVPINRTGSSNWHQRVLSTYMCSSTHMAFSQNISHPMGGDQLYGFLPEHF